MGTPDYKNTTIPYDTVGCILFDCNRLIVAFRRLVSEAARIQVLELGIHVGGHRETGESNPSYTTCPLYWQSLSSSRDTFSEDGSPNGTDVQRMNSSKPGSEKTNARSMFSLPVFLRLTHVSEGMKTIAPA